MTYPDRYRVRVCAAILRPGDQILVVRESRLGLEHINLPGGLPQFDETLEGAVSREVREETGYDVIPTEIAYVAEHRSERWSDSMLDICFYAQVQAQAERPERAGEIIVSVEWVSLYDEDLLRDVPHASLLASSKRGRYIDEVASSLRARADAWERGPSA